MLHTLAVNLAWIAITFLGLTVVGVTIYLLQSHRRRANYLGDPSTHLRYFIQKQVDYRDQIVGYECLLRQQNADGSWTLPVQMEGLPLQRVVRLLDVAFRSLPQTPVKLSINLSYRQLMSSDFEYFVRWAVSTILPMQLVVEYATDDHVDNTINRRLLMRHIQQGRKLGMLFLLDNFSLASAELARIEWLLPAVDVVKVSVTEFRQVANQVWSDVNLATWQRISSEYHLQLILTEIETSADQALADQLGVGLRQGYHFGYPVNMGGATENGQEKSH